MTTTPPTEAQEGRGILETIIANQERLMDTVRIQAALYDDLVKRVDALQALAALHPQGRGES